MQVAVERLKEFSEIDREPAEFIEPRPAPTSSSKGNLTRYSRLFVDSRATYRMRRRRSLYPLRCLNLVERFPSIRPFLVSLNSRHSSQPQLYRRCWRKVGILGRTGCGKSTLGISIPQPWRSATTDDRLITVLLSALWKLPGDGLSLTA